MTKCVHFQLVESHVHTYTGRIGQIEMMVNEGLYDDTISGPIPRLGVVNSITNLVWNGPHSAMHIK